MKNETSWRPSKYVQSGRHWASSNDPEEVGLGSRLITDSVAKIYSKHLAACARGRLLDLGCGKAPLYGIYRGLVDSVTCSDWIDSDHVDVVSDLAQPLPFDDAAFDTIILSDVWEHVPDPALVWHEMTRVLTPGGHIVMNVPFFYWLHAHPHDFYRYTSFALSSFVSNNGLELLQLETLGVCTGGLGRPAREATHAGAMGWETARLVGSKRRDAMGMQPHRKAVGPGISTAFPTWVLCYCQKTFADFGLTATAYKSSLQ